MRLPPEERVILRSLCGELRTLLAAEDPSVGRLFPPAYADDPAASGEYARLMHDDLVAGHLQAIDVMETSVDATKLDEEQAAAWLAAINDIRLVLGTRLDVTEELYETGLPESDPRAAQFAVYQYLGYLQEQVVEAVAGGLGS